MSGMTNIQGYIAAGPLGEEGRGARSYILGHSPNEIDRLIGQAKILGPITERLLRSAGMAPGMRVLDLGCGAGDVSMLAAELVGPSGSIVGIDRSAVVLAIARQRARAAGLDHVSFAESAVETFSSSEPFDCVIGRYVLVHQADPEGFLRAAARFVRPGGVIAFHELSLGAGQKSYPPVRSWDLTIEMVTSSFRDAVPRWDVGDHMFGEFRKAGLPSPNLFCEVPLGGGEDSPFYDWIVETLRSMQPQLVKMGVMSDEVMAIDTLKDRLRTAVTTAGSQISSVPQICAWARLPS